MNIKAIVRPPIRSAAVKGRPRPFSRTRIIRAFLLIAATFGLAGGIHRAARHVGDPEISALCDGMKCILGIEAGWNTNFLMQPPRLQIEKGCGLRGSNFKVIDEDSAQAVLDRSQVTEPCDVRVISGGKTFTYPDVRF